MLYWGMVKWGNSLEGQKYFWICNKLWLNDVGAVYNEMITLLCLMLCLSVSICLYIHPFIYCKAWCMWQHTCGGQKITCREGFFYHVGSRDLSYLVASASSCGAMSLVIHTLLSSVETPLPHSPVTYQGKASDEVMTMNLSSIWLVVFACVCVECICIHVCGCFRSSSNATLLVL